MCLKMSKSDSEKDKDSIAVISYDQSNGLGDFLLWSCSEVARNVSEVIKNS